MSDDAAGGSSLPNPLHAPKRFGRDTVEFGRTAGFFDATFAIAATLLVVTLAPETANWSDWSKFIDAEWSSLLSFVISFVVICAYWWANHRLVATLDTMSTRFVGFGLIMLGFVVLLPFTTGGLGDVDNRASGEVAAVGYAVNVAMVSLSTMLLAVVAAREGLYRRAPTPDQLRGKLIGQIDTPAVFLLSIPVTLVLGPAWGRYSWLLLAVTGGLVGRIGHRIAGDPPPGAPKDTGAGTSS
jgi:uncharacterized membrane protein